MTTTSKFGFIVFAREQQNLWRVIGKCAVVACATILPFNRYCTRPNRNVPGYLILADIECIWSIRHLHSHDFVGDGDGNANRKRYS